MKSDFSWSFAFWSIFD